jgi:hypothetical protein
VGEARRLYDIVKQQGRDGAAGIVQGEKALSHIGLEDELHAPSEPEETPADRSPGGEA